MNFKSLLSGFANALNSSECLVCLTYVQMESCLRDNRRSVVLFLSFPKSLVMSLQSGMTESVQIRAEMSSLSCLALLAVESS
jgi:hypothetical protein